MLFTQYVYPIQDVGYIEPYYVYRYCTRGAHFQVYTYIYAVHKCRYHIWVHNTVRKKNGRKKPPKKKMFPEEKLFITVVIALGLKLDEIH